MTSLSRHVLRARYMLVALLASSLLACSTQTTVSGPSSVAGLQGVETEHGTFRLEGLNGTSVDVRPEDTLTVKTLDGREVVAKAKRICRNGSALYVRDADAPCNAASRIAAWDEIASVGVRQFDGGGTVAIVTLSAAAAAAIVVAVVVLASSSKESKGNEAPKEPPPREHIPARPTVGGGSAGGRSLGGGGSRDTRPPVVATGEVRPPVVAGEHSPHRHEHRSSLTIFSLGGAYDPYDVPARASAGPSPSPASGPMLELEPRDNLALDAAAPLFSHRAVRRAVFRPSLRVDGGVCVTSDRCFAGAARVGLTFVNLVELSGGIRWEAGTSGSTFGTFGAGLHGQFPRAPALALFLGTQVAIGDGFRVAPTAGLRVRPAADFWIGLQPAGVTYFSREKRFAYTPSIELAYEF